MSSRILSILLRIFWGIFLLFTSVYCLLAYLPFTYSALIKAPPYDWIRWFVSHYSGLYWVALAAAAIGFRPIRNKAKLLILAVQAAVGLYLLLHPILASVQPNWPTYFWSLLILCLAVALAAIESGQYLVAHRNDITRAWLLDYPTSLFAATFIALLWAVGAQWRLYSESHTGISLTIVEVTGWSVLSHILVAILLLTVLNLIAIIAAKMPWPKLAQHMLGGLFIFGTIWFMLLRFFENALSSAHHRIPAGYRPLLRLSPATRFYSCHALTGVTIGANVTGIGDGSCSVGGAGLHLLKHGQLLLQMGAHRLEPLRLRNLHVRQLLLGSLDFGGGTARLCLGEFLLRGADLHLHFGADRGALFQEIVVKYALRVLRGSGFDVGYQARDFIGDGRRDRHVLGGHHRRRGFTRHAQNRAGQIAGQRRLPFRLQACQRFLPVAADDRYAQEARIAFFQIERLNAIGRGRVGVRFNGGRVSDDVNLASVGLRHLRQQLVHPSGKILQRLRRTSRWQHGIKTQFHRRIQVAQLAERIRGKSGAAGSGPTGTQRRFAVFKPACRNRGSQQEEEQHAQRPAAAPGGGG
jgi:hypothetical protein